MKHVRDRRTDSSRRRKRGGERGVALVMVLGVLAVVGVMAAHLAAVSEVTAREARVAALREELKYVAESATARAYWLLLADRAEFSSRKLGLDMSDRDDTQEPWMTDGKVHDLEVLGYKVRVAVYDAEAGLDCSGRDAEAKLRKVLVTGNADADEEQEQDIDSFLDVLADYVDADDTQHLDGMEEGDYEAEGLPDMPRNAPMQFREEIYWLEGAAKVLGKRTDGETGGVDSRTVRLIAPPGFKFKKSKSGKPSFFASAPEMIRRVANLTDGELNEALRARDLWQKDGTPVEDSMDPSVFSRLQGKFSFEESGVATIMASAFSPDGSIRRTVRVTRDSRTKGHAFADSKKEYWAYWEKIVF